MTGSSFTFGRYNSADDWGIKVIATDTLMPPKRARKIVIPGRSGSYDFGANAYDERTLRMRCILERQISKAELREIVYHLAKKDRLTLWNEPDKYYIAELYNEAEVLDFPLEMFREFTLDFICDPFAYRTAVTLPLKAGMNPIAYRGTAETPCVIVLRNDGETDIQNITLTAIRRIR